MEKIFANLKKGVVAPCYLLYGEEEYLVNENLNKILDLLVPQSDRDLSLFFLDGENADLNNLIDDILTPSLLGARKVVVVKNTTLFHSRENVAKLIPKIRENLDENPSRAAKYFLSFLKIAGLSIEDLQNSGWKKIADDEWNKIVKGDAGEEREKWLPRVLEICAASGVTEASGRDSTERLEQIFKNGLPGGNCLIFTADAVDKKRKLFKVISELGAVLYFGVVQGKKGESSRRETLQKQAQQLLERHGKKMSPPAWIALGKKTGFDLRRSMSELEKLVSYIGDKTLIDKDDVEEAVGRTREDDIFDLTAALSEKNQLAALEALQNLLNQGIHHLIILSMLVREIRLLLQARTLADSGKLPKISPKMEYGWFQKSVYPVLGELNTAGSGRKDLIFNQHPWAIYNTLRNCARFTSARLIEFLEELIEMERAFKTSGPNPRLLLENFLIKSCN
jgi:DNA polymerase-3 subunit delta